MILQSDINKIASYIYTLRNRLIKIFSPEFLAVKYCTIRKEYLHTCLKSILYDLNKDFYELPLSEFLISEIDNLVSSLNEEIIIKNLNKPINEYTRDAIKYNFKRLTIELDEIKSNLNHKLLSIQNQQKKKFHDVKVSNIELSLFILLASKYGLISYNFVNETDKSNSFSVLTNFSEHTLRQNISGEQKSNPNLLPLTQINLDNLEKILNNILTHINSITV